MSTTPSVSASPRERIASVDIVRGLVMVLMAIDHVRVYAGVPAGGPTYGVFFTRWVTHFCAPAFVFFAGTSAFLHGEKLQDRGALQRFLLTRGAWLVVLELTYLRVMWAFNLDYAHYMLAGVIWMLGWCMILMSLLVRLPVAATGAFGLLVIVAHNASAWLPPDTVEGLLGGGMSGLWRILYFGGGLTLFGSAEPNFLVLYVIVPWIGVMAAGYAFGAVLRQDAARRRRDCLLIGGTAIVAFLVLRYFNLYGDRPWTHPPEVPGLIAFLATTKYPASLLFLLMTLGPTIAVLPWLEHARGRVASWLTVFGRVPMFYYLLHIPLIHLVALLISLVRTPSATWWLFDHHPMRPAEVPEGYMWSLPLLYLVWALVVVALYFPCRRFARLRAERSSPWLSYL